MKRTAWVFLSGVVVLLGVGCGQSNRVVGDRLIKNEQYFGDLGVTGHLNQITVLRGSDLVKLSVIGDANQINIDEGVTLGKVEVWGSDNVIAVPEHLVIRQNSVGNRTTIMRRPRGVPLGAHFAPAEKPRRPAVEAAEDAVPHEAGRAGAAREGGTPAPADAPPSNPPRPSPQPAPAPTGGTGSSFTPPDVP